MRTSKPSLATTRESLSRLVKAEEFCVELVVCSGFVEGPSVHRLLSDVCWERGRAPDFATPGLAISPDGMFVIFMVANEDEFLAYPIAGGEPLAIKGLQRRNGPITWSADGHSLFVSKIGRVPGEVYSVDLTTGKRRLWRTFMPPDPAGVE